jgi:hypothetical protein
MHCGVEEPEDVVLHHGSAADPAERRAHVGRLEFLGRDLCDGLGDACGQQAK